jgi:pyrimidine-nucleoside phosphorylase
MDEKVDPSVGFVISAKPGMRVTKGQDLATIHARSREDLNAGRSTLEHAIVIGDSASSALPLISHRVTARGVERLA